MSKTTASKRTPAKQTSTRTPKSAIRVSPAALVITLTKQHQRQAEQCLKKSGKIMFTFKEISVTKLPATLKDGVLID